jgi:NitT/TauT family transport system substrate-binding protein
MVMDTFGCTPKFIKENGKLVQAMVNSYFEALEMINKDPAKANEIMGSVVKQTGEQFAKSSAYLRWQDKAANNKFFAGDIQAFSKEAATCCSRWGSSRACPT